MKDKNGNEIEVKQINKNSYSIDISEFYEHFSVKAPQRHFEYSIICVLDFLYSRGKGYKISFSTKKLTDEQRNHDFEIKAYKEIIKDFDYICLKELETTDESIVEMYFTEQFNDIKKIKNHILKLESEIESLSEKLFEFGKKEFENNIKIQTDEYFKLNKKKWRV